MDPWTPDYFVTGLSFSGSPPVIIARTCSGDPSTRSFERKVRALHAMRIGEHDKAMTSMEPHVSILTLGVDDLERAVVFYRDGLGFSTKGIIGTAFENGAVAFFNLRSGLKLALWPRKSLAADAGLPLQSSSSTEFSLGHNVSSPHDVDSVMRQAQLAGAKIVKPAQPTFYGGYAGYFQDPDGHLWEIAFNPGFETLA
ncbi:MAG: VOC family protein [Hyphomicrobiaceae bacterium]